MGTPTSMSPVRACEALQSIKAAYYRQYPRVMIRVMLHVFCVTRGIRCPTLSTKLAMVDGLHYGDTEGFAAWIEDWNAITNASARQGVICCSVCTAPSPVLCSVTAAADGAV